MHDHFAVIRAQRQSCPDGLGKLGNWETGVPKAKCDNAFVVSRPDSAAPRTWETRYPGFTLHPEAQVSSGNQQSAELAGESGAVSQVSRVSHSDQLQPCEGDPPLWGAERWCAYFEERAAMREFEGGLPRAEAERLAFEDTLAHWLCRNPAPPSEPHRGCVHCGGRDGVGQALLPVLASGGHTWVHEGCRAAWLAQRRDQARRALTSLLPRAGASSRLAGHRDGRPMC